MNKSGIGQTIASTALTLGAITGHPAVTEAAELAGRIATTGTPVTPIWLAMEEAGSAMANAFLRYISPDGEPNVLKALPETCRTGTVPPNPITSDPRVTPEMKRLLYVSILAEAYDVVSPSFPYLCEVARYGNEEVPGIIPTSLLPTEQFNAEMSRHELQYSWMFFAHHTGYNHHPTINTTGKIDFLENQETGIAELRRFLGGMRQYRSTENPDGWETAYLIERRKDGEAYVITVNRDPIDNTFTANRADLNTTGEIYPITYHGKLFIRQILPDGEIEVLAVDNTGHTYSTASPETLKALGDVKPVDIVREWGGNDPRYWSAYNDEDGNPRAIISESGWYIGSERPADGNGIFKQTVNITIIGEDGPEEVVEVIDDNETLLMGMRILGPTEQDDGYYFAYATDRYVVLGMMGLDGKVVKTKVPIPASMVGNPIGLTQFERHPDGSLTGGVYGPHVGFGDDPEGRQQDIAILETALKQMPQDNGIEPAGASWRDPRLDDYPRQ